MTKARNSTAVAAPATRNVAQLVRALADTWPEATCEIDHINAYQLLVGTILAAQSTDKRINMITPALFAKYPNPRALANADQAELEVLIHSSGFFRAKAKSLLGMARAVVANHNGEIPRTMAELVKLPGVARKTGNVVLGTAFGIADGIVVDTHVTRLAFRLGLTKQTDAVKIEQDLCAQLPKSEWISFANRIIWHGRRVCHAHKPACGECTLAPHCPSVEMPTAAKAPAKAKPKAAANKRKAR
ncbi:MAG TPA: endonuclease III [Kofleriaceae bacterium]|nr:endonuclease III [Kofleriaceae bacterium]